MAATTSYVKTHPPAQIMMGLLYIAFALTGVLTALPGPLLPIMLKQWSLTDAQGGSIIAAQFLANLIGALFANRNLRVSLLLGLVLMTIGTFGLTVLPWPDLLAAIFCYGLGLGMAMPAVNLTVAARRADSRAASLSVLNSVWGVGAISCPVFVFLAQRFASINALLIVLSVTLAFLFFSILKAWQPIARTEPVAKLESQLGGRQSLLLFALLFFLYVGAETCIASWINVYAERIGPAAGLIFSSPVVCFWAALVIGRGGVPLILKWISDEGLYVISLIFALLGLLPILGGHSAGMVILGATLCGLALAPVFPLLLAFASESLLSKPSSGWVFACASLGGAVLP